MFSAISRGVYCWASARRWTASLSSGSFVLIAITVVATAAHVLLALVPVAHLLVDPYTYCNIRIALHVLLGAPTPSPLL